MEERNGHIAKYRSVWGRWQDLARDDPDHEAIIHWDALGEPFRWTYGGLLDMALKFAQALRDNGVRQGDVCAIIIRHNKYFYPIYMGIAAVGAIPAVLAYPNVRLHPDKFVSGISGMAQKSGLGWVLTERELEPVIKPLMMTGETSIKGIFFPLEWIEKGLAKRLGQAAFAEKGAVADRARPFLLQHSSGTSGLQKAVVLSNAAVLEHVQRYSEDIGMSPADKIASWLPLYHDMGLIAAFNMPLIFGIPSVQIDPFQWISVPAILFQAITREQATLTWLPNFAYNFMADRIPEDDMQNIDLSCVRMFINCSEVVRAESHRKFFQRFRKYGVKKESLATCYAMAETTFAVTQSEPGHEAFTMAVDRSALTKNTVRPCHKGSSRKVCLSSGRPISGCFLKIIDRDGSELGEDRVGRVKIKSVSLFNGYRNNPEKTGRVLKDGWYLSGDLGFCHQGEYFIIGREDDIIILAGKNIYPEDIEDAVNEVPGVIPGRAVAFGLYDPEVGTEDVCVIAETKYETQEDRDRLKLAIMQAGIGIDVSISKVYLVPPRWLVKSSSGKISRKANKERIK